MKHVSKKECCGDENVAKLDKASMDSNILAKNLCDIDFEKCPLEEVMNAAVKPPNSYEDLKTDEVKADHKQSIDNHEEMVNDVASVDINRDFLVSNGSVNLSDNGLETYVHGEEYVCTVVTTLNQNNMNEGVPMDEEKSHLAVSIASNMASNVKLAINLIQKEEEAKNCSDNFIDTSDVENEGTLLCIENLCKRSDVINEDCKMKSGGDKESTPSPDEKGIAVTKKREDVDSNNSYETHEIKGKIENYNEMDGAEHFREFEILQSQFELSESVDNERKNVCNERVEPLVYDISESASNLKQLSAKQMMKRECIVKDEEESCNSELHIINRALIESNSNTDEDVHIIADGETYDSGHSTNGGEEEASLSVDYLQKLETIESSPAPGSLLSADKLKNIMQFLDEVEKVEEDVRLEVLKQSKEAELTESARCSDDLISDRKDSVIESASQVASDISNAISAQKLEIDEKKRTVEMMKKAIGQQKEFTTMQMREMEKEHKQQLQLQRQEYEGTIQRHLAFIDQLIDDKKVLTERCEGLVTKMKDIDQKYSTKIKQMTENHAIELKKQKEISEAAEKLRREKWIKEKTQEIKEITVKGLEPDIQRLIGKHKAEIRKIKAAQQGVLLDSDERVGKKYIEQMEDLRAHLEKEKEIAVRKERENARERFEHQMREEEAALQQQRRRLYREIEEEKERCAEEMKQFRKEADERKSAYEESCKQSTLSIQEDYEKRMRDLQDNHQMEVKQYKEQIDIEKQQWIENYMKKQETHLLAKERELKENVRESRDKEIEMVIARLEQETAVNREEAEKTAENRIKRIRDKYENEIKELEHCEKNIQEKYRQIKEKMGDTESEFLRLQSECKQKDQELKDVKNITDRLQEERGKVTDVIRQEFADRLVVLEEESKRLRNELSEEKARHKFNVDRVNAEKAEEMDELHKRVKKAIVNKDENTKLLKQQMMAAEKRAEHLEQLLAEQRKKLLSD